MSFLAIYLTASLVLLSFINSMSTILNKVNAKVSTVPTAHSLQNSKPFLSKIGITGDAIPKENNTSESGYGCALMLLLSLVLISPNLGTLSLENANPNYALSALESVISEGALGGLSRFSLLIEYLILMLTMVIVQIVKPSRLKESALLVTFSTLGLILMIETSNLIGLYLAVELYSLSAYILASGAEGVYSSNVNNGKSHSLMEANKSSISAGLKYFILSALSSGILVVGISLLYGVTGELSLNGLSRSLSMLTLSGVDGALGGYNSENFLAVEATVATVGMGLILSTLLFKIGAAPLHFWVPDVYSSVSLFVNFYMISVPKIGILCTLVKISFIWSGTPSTLAYTSLLLGFSILSLIVGAVGGLVQIKTARLLAYSSINHVGYILLALYAAHIPGSALWNGIPAENLNAYCAPSPLHIYGIGLYLLVYCFMTVNMFTVLYSLKFYKEKQNLTLQHVKIRGDFISGLKGLSSLNPFLAASMAITLLSMAGVPPLAGFVAKLTVYMAVLDSGAFAPAVFAVLCSVISAFYYLRLIKVAYFYNDEFSISQKGGTTATTATRAKVEDKESLGLRPFSSNLISLCTLLIIFFPILRPQFIFLYLN